jgi:protein phosphatase 2C family protein 2/3
LVVVFTIACPDITKHEVVETDEYVVLASDGFSRNVSKRLILGVWNHITNAEAVEFINMELASGQELHTIAGNLMNHCLGRGSYDNMTVVIVALLNGLSENEWKSKFVGRVKNKDDVVAAERHGRHTNEAG